MNIEEVAKEATAKKELKKNSLSIRLKDQERTKVMDEAYKLRTNASELVRSVLKVYFNEKGESF